MTMKTKIIYHSREAQYKKWGISVLFGVLQIEEVTLNM